MSVLVQMDRATGLIIRLNQHKAIRDLKQKSVNIVPTLVFQSAPLKTTVAFEKTIAIFPSLYRVQCCALCSANSHQRCTPD